MFELVGKNFILIDRTLINLTKIVSIEQTIKHNREYTVFSYHLHILCDTGKTYIFEFSDRDIINKIKSVL